MKVALDPQNVAVNRVLDEGLRTAIDLLSRVILTEPPVEAWWT